MKSTLAILSVLGTALAQGVTESIAPKGSYPDGCEKSYSGQLEVTVDAVQVSQKRSLMPQRRTECGADGILVLTLDDGVLMDAKQRTGYIASNYQFQFDKPAQAGAIYTAGYSVCGNGSIALGASTTFYQCQSGSFWNLYDRKWAEQCQPVQLIAMPCGGADPPGYASQYDDGQIVATQLVTTTIVKPISDGQPQVITTEVAVPICQITDGQVQVHSTPCASITSTPKTTPTAVPVSQYSDGQIQVTPPGTVAMATSPAAPVTTSAPSSSAAPVVVVSSSVPVVAPVSAPNSTVATSVKTSVTPVSPSTTPSTISTSNAGRVEMGSLAALVVGLVGAMLFLN